MPLKNKKSAPGLYIHVPFCLSKCNYCTFYSITEYSLIPKYIQALFREMKSHGGRFDGFDTVYFGGGTPSVLGRENIELIVNEIHDVFSLISGYEMTIEVNPYAFDIPFLHAIRSMGFNRINIGIQSFNDRFLKFLGRSHDSKEAEKALRDVQNTGFCNIGLDLIYSVPEQSISDWTKTLRKAVSLTPQHLSCYELTIEKKNPLGLLRESGAITEPDESLQYELFMRTSEFLESKGYFHYEVSNFARSPELASRHNRKYWEHAPYLGLGPSAHSFSERQRWWNISDVEKYAALLEKGASPLESSEAIGRDELWLEMLGLGLRTRRGICLAEMEELRGRALRHSGIGVSE